MIARTHHCPQYRTEISSPNHHRKSIHIDHPGSVRAMAERGGPVTEENVYTAFGDPVPASAPVIMATAQPDEEKGYIGERYDPSAGLQYLNARYYDPVVGCVLCTHRPERKCSEPLDNGA